MKICLIKASGKSTYSEYKKKRGGPPQSIFSAAAATPPNIDLEIVDETNGMCANPDIAADLVVIFAATPDAMRAYELADHYRANGLQVAIGGLHATFMQEEAAGHADTVLTGECEAFWPQLLDDAERRSLKPVYQGSFVDMATLNPYPTNLITQHDYKGTWSVLVSRGCPHKCSFCTVPGMLGKLRHRPIEHVVQEIKQSDASFFELHSDNLTHDREHAMALFAAIEPLGIAWGGETTIKIADDPELLEAAARSGCMYLLIGLETPSKQALKYAGKGFIKTGTVKEAIERIHAHGIIVDSAALFGFDEHTVDVFEESADYFSDVGVDISVPVIVTPYPGTRLFAKLEKEGRILTRDWSQYDGAHAVYQPKNLSIEELEAGAEDYYWKFNAPLRWARRKVRQVGDFGFNAMYAG